MSQWYAKIEIGKRQAEFYDGTLSGILKQLLPRIIEHQHDPKSIVLSLQGCTFEQATKAQIEQAKRIAEVESSLEPTTGEIPSPAQNESYEHFYDRLIQAGSTEMAAEFVANDWYDREPNPRLAAWLNDPKAARFRQLNSSHAAFEAAMPEEYEGLKQYVLKEFAEFCAGIIFRTA